jgi:hypothetical protein
MNDSLLPDDIVALAQRVIAENKAAGRIIAVAESCTGGLVSAALTEVAGSSAVFDRGFVTYSNESKREVLGPRKSHRRFRCGFGRDRLGNGARRAEAQPCGCCSSS